MAQPRTIFVATVGGQPQIITFALDHLLRSGEPIQEVHLVYMKPRIKRLEVALKKLLFHLKSQPQYEGLKIVKHPIYLNQSYLMDISASADAALAWEFVNRLITELKQTGYRMHVVISGGRRIMGMLMMSAASVHFYPNDKLWHTFAPDSIREQSKHGEVMHLEEDSGFELVEVPMLPLGTMFLGIRDINHFNQKRAFLDKQQESRCLEVINRLTPKQKEVLEQFALGLNPDAVVDQLMIAKNTVNSHKSRIFEHCREVWELPDDTRLTYHFLAEHFRPFFE